MSMSSRTKKPVSSLHPALHFESDLVSVGILDASGRVGFVSRRTGQLPAYVSPQAASGHKYQIEDRSVHPAPAPYSRLKGRWDPADLERFCKDGTSPTFVEFLSYVRSELLGQIEFARPEIASLVSCWIAGTYFYPLFTAYPRLNVTGRKGSGKSKLLQVISATAFNGLHMVAPTGATLFRLIEPLRPTLCLDEMERLDKGELGTIGSILNAGYKAGISVPRTEEIRGQRTVQDYDTYAPIALAGIQGVNLVLADRAITIVMQRGCDKTRLNAEIDESDPAFAAIRAMGYRLALTDAPVVVCGLNAVRTQQDTFMILEGRPLELFRPLIALALLAKAEGDESFLADLSVLVREDSREVLDPEAMRVFVELEKRLQAAPSITVFPKDLTGATDDSWSTPEQVGRLLQALGFRPGKRKSAGQPYTITREQFREQARRYGYPVELPELESVAEPQPGRV